MAESEKVANQVLEPPEVLGVEAVSVEAITPRVTAKTQPGQRWRVQRALNGAITSAIEAAALDPYSAGPPNGRSHS